MGITAQDCRASPDPQPRIGSLRANVASFAVADAHEDRGKSSPSTGCEVDKAEQPTMSELDWQTISAAFGLTAIYAVLWAMALRK